MAEWQTTPFPECIVRHGVKRHNQINSSEMQVAGRFPVVDQGQSFIAGYTDDEEKVVRDGLPYVIFGDHTRCFKFVEFPFVLGADGTKVLKPDATRFDPKFFYFALMGLNIPSRGYNRHFKLLKESSIPHPADKLEQQKIAALLVAVQRAIEQQERLIALTTELKKALMHKLFTEGTRGEPQKQTEIGPVPESWGLMPVGDLGECITGSTPRTAVKENYTPPERDFIAPADLGQTKYIYESERQVSAAGLATVRPLPKDAVLCVCIGSSLGKTGMTFKDESCTNQQINAIVCDSSNDADFVYYLLTHFSEYWRSHATFGTVPILSKGQFCEVKVPCTSDRTEQETVATVLAACDAKLEHHMAEIKAYRDLFRTLLHQLMTAQVRVNDMDLSELGHEPVAAELEETA